MTAVRDWRKSSAVYHERAKEYDSWFDDSLLFGIETAAVDDLKLPPAEPALEIGVGSGRFAEDLQCGFGVDPAAAPLRIAANRGIRVCQAVGEALPFRNQSHARVSLFFTLCFVQDPAKVLAETHRVLQDNGQLLLGFVPATGPWGRHLQQKKENGHPFYQYAYFFRASEIQTLITAHGFTITAGVSSLYQAPGEVTQPESSRSGIDENSGFAVILAAKQKIS